MGLCNYTNCGLFRNATDDMHSRAVLPVLFLNVLTVVRVRYSLLMADDQLQPQEDIESEPWSVTV